MNEQRIEPRFDTLIRAAIFDYPDTNAELMRSNDAGEEKIPRRADKKVKRLINRFFDGKSVQRSAKTPRRIAFVLAAAILAAILCLSVGGKIADRVNENKTEHDVYDQYDYSFEGKHETTVFFEPSYVPKGFTRKVRLEAKGALIIEYCLDGEPAVVYSQYAGNSTFFAIDNEHTTKKSVKIKKLDGTLYTVNGGSMVLNWTDGEYLYQLDCLERAGISEKKLIKMAKSLKKSKECN